MDTNIIKKKKNNNKYALILHYVDWCHYCHDFLPIFEDIKNNNNNNNIQFYKVNHTNDQVVIDSSKLIVDISLDNIDSFPTIIFYDGIRNKFTKYNKERDEKTIIKFINKKIKKNNK